MAWQHDSNRPQRAAAAAAALAIHGLIGAALIWGLAVRQGAAGDEAPLPPLATFEIAPPPPTPPPPVPEAAPDDAAPEPSAAEGREGEALTVEAPPAAIPLAPAPAAPIAGTGSDPTAGAGDRAAGPGAGGQGQGSGGGGEGGIATPAQRIAGQLRDRDYPRAAEAARMAGTVSLRFRVRTDGRVDSCSVTRSSGHAVLDDLTCRLLTERYRFRPAATAAGAAVESTLQTSFTWGTRPR